MSTTRRQFLIGGVRITAALPLASWLHAKPEHRAEGPKRSLVVIQLTGGNDGLNTVVPTRQDDYYRMRPTLALARNRLAPLAVGSKTAGDFGLHPSLAGFAELFDDGKLAVMHGVGYPGADRSHFRSMEVWHTAEPKDAMAGSERIGWLGRLSDQITAKDPSTLAALHVGDGELPQALFARDTFAPTARDERGFRLDGPSWLAKPRGALLDARSDDPDALAFLRDAARTSYRTAARMEEVAQRETGLEYPNTSLGRGLRLIASLVRGGFDTRLFHIQLGGFDTHARQAPAHAALLGELSRSVSAFQRDLDAGAVSDRVVTFVFSEFGRRAAENGSKGTDHGAAAPAFLIGAPVRGGMHGQPPALDRLVDGDVPFTTDFRSIYTTLEESWLGLEPSTSLPALDLLA